jgi:outer membrane receptor for ferrienterochelin and colicins
MDEVVITAQYAPEKADKSIYRINVINAREIEQKGATNLADLMKTELNMRVSQSGVLGSSMTLQGLGGQYVKFLVDGVPVIGRMNGEIDLNQINMANVDHVEIVEGPMSIIYGSSALAGAINIITKENNASAFSAQANSYVESVNVYNFDGSVSGNNKHHSFSIDGGRNFREGFSHMDTARSKDFKPFRQVFGNAYYKYTRAGFNIKIKGEYFNDLLIFKGNLIAPLMINAFDSYFTTNRSTLTANVSKKINDNLNFKLVSSYSMFDRIKKSYFKDLTTLEQVVSGNPEDHDTTSFSSYMANGIFSYNLPSKNLGVQGGFDLNMEQGTGKRILGKTQQIDDYAAFLLMKWNPFKKFTIQPGLRFIHNSKFNAPLVYALSTKYDITKDFSARLSYSKGFLAPDIKQLYLEFVDINHNVLGNQDLLAEIGKNLSLDLSYHKDLKTKSFSAELNVFYNHINDAIDLAQELNSSSSGQTYMYINVGQKKTEGFTLELSADFYPKWKISAGFGETGVLDVMEVQSIKRDSMFWSPSIKSEIVYKPFKNDFSIAMFYKFTGKTNNFIYSDGQIAKGETESYHTMDLTVSKNFFKNRVKLSTGSKNIFDVTNIVSTGSGSGAHSGGGRNSTPIAYGRTYFIKVSYVFNKYN